MSDQRRVKFNCWLNERGIQLIGSRRFVADIAFFMSEPLLPESVFDLVNQLQVKTISRSTVYSTLRLLSESAAVRVDHNFEGPS